MKKYLTTGVIVQVFIIVLRRVLGKSRGVFKENKSNVFFWITALFGSVVNIVAWPITIASEAIWSKIGI